MNHFPSSDDNHKLLGEHKTFDNEYKSSTLVQNFISFYTQLFSTTSFFYSDLVVFRSFLILIQCARTPTHVAVNVSYFSFFDNEEMRNIKFRVKTIIISRVQFSHEIINSLAKQTSAHNVDEV